MNSVFIQKSLLIKASFQTNEAVRYVMTRTNECNNDFEEVNKILIFKIGMPSLFAVLSPIYELISSFDICSP